MLGSAGFLDLLAWPVGLDLLEGCGPTTPCLSLLFFLWHGIEPVRSCQQLAPQTHRCSTLMPKTNRRAIARISCCRLAGRSPDQTSWHRFPSKAGESPMSGGFMKLKLPDCNVPGALTKPDSQPIMSAMESWPMQSHISQCPRLQRSPRSPPT
mgnify:FL=1